MKDVFGNEISVGDVIAFNPPKYWNGWSRGSLAIGKVVGFTPKQVRVEYERSEGVLDTTVKYPHDVARKA